MLMLPLRGRAIGIYLCLLFLATAQAQVEPLISQPNSSSAADSVITFNEIMYHPATTDPGGEWLELVNQMSVNMDISNWHIEGGVTFQFPTNTVFNANSYLIVAADPARFRTRPGSTNIFGPFTGRLSSGGETLRLRNQSGRLLDELSYNDHEPWPVGADGSGASLSKRDPFNGSGPGRIGERARNRVARQGK